VKARLARAAEADLVEIGLHIAESNPLAAHRWVARLRARCRSLGRFPERSPIAFSTNPPMRRASEGAYNLFYTVQVDYVRVERILHGARDIGAHIPLNSA
jgi:toxin ParE1/3/4